MCKDLNGHEDSSTAQVEDAKFEDRRGFIIDPAVNAGFGATRRLERRHSRRTRRLGATRSFPCGAAEGCVIRGDSNIHPSAQPEDRIRGDPEIHRWHSRSMRNLGRLGERIAGGVGGAEIRGDSKLHRHRRQRMRDARKLKSPSPAQLKDARTRGNPERRRRSSRRIQTRGNPGMRSRHKRKIEEPGKPGASSPSWTG